MRKMACSPFGVSGRKEQSNWMDADESDVEKLKRSWRWPRGEAEGWLRGRGALGGSAGSQPEGRRLELSLSLLTDLRRKQQAKGMRVGGRCWKMKRGV